MGAELRAHVHHPRLAGGGQRRSGRGGERLDSHSGADSIKGGGRHALDESLQESAGGHRHAEPICETTALVTQITIGSTIEQPRAVEPKATSTLKSAKLSTYGRLPRPGSPPCTMPIQGALLRHDVHIPSTVISGDRVPQLAHWYVFAFRGFLLLKAPAGERLNLLADDSGTPCAVAAWANSAATSSSLSAVSVPDSRASCAWVHFQPRPDPPF